MGHFDLIYPCFIQSGFFDVYCLAYTVSDLGFWVSSFDGTSLYLCDFRSGVFDFIAYLFKVQIWMFFAS